MPHQREALDSNARIKFPQWGRGAGKSVYGITELLKNTLRNPKGIGFIVAQTGPMLEQWRLGKLEPYLAWFEQVNGFRIERRFRRTPFPHYQLITGGQWWFIPSDNPDKLRGPDFAYGIIEEAAICLNQQALWTAIYPTFRSNPEFTLILPTTPRPESFLVQHCLERAREGDPKYWTTKAPSYVNTFTDRAFWESLKKELSPEMYAQEVEAEMVKVEGAVYGRSFIDNVCRNDFKEGNVVDLDFQKFCAMQPERYSLIGGVDWGTSYNTFVALLHDHKLDIDIVVDELCLDGDSVQIATGKIAERLKLYPEMFGGVEMHRIWTDPNGAKWNASLRRRVPETCAVNWTWKKNLTDIETGVEIVQRRICDAEGTRRLFISKAVVEMEQSGPNGRGIYRGITGGYRYAVILKTGAFKPEPLKDGKYDHSCDALRYPMVNTYYSTIYRS